MMEEDSKMVFLLAGYIIGKYATTYNTIIDTEHAADILLNEFGLDVRGEKTIKAKVMLRNFISDQQFHSSTIGTTLTIVDDSDSAYDRAMRGL